LAFERFVDHPMLLQLDQVETLLFEHFHIMLEFGHGGHRFAAQV